jgi:hypothetical protein
VVWECGNVGGIQVPSNGWRLGEVLRSLYARRGRQKADEIIRGRTSQFRLQTASTDLLLLQKLKIPTALF